MHYYFIEITIIVLKCVCSIAGISRPAHNSLYQMVKKRTLEARSKLQANKYPNQNACMKVAQTVEFVPDMDDDVEAITTASNMQSPPINFTAASAVVQEPQFRVVSFIPSFIHFT